MIESSVILVIRALDGLNIYGCRIISIYKWDVISANSRAEVISNEIY